MLLFAWGSVGCSQVSCTEVPANPYVVTLAVAKMNNKYSLWAHPGGICDKDLNGAKTNASMKHFFIHLQWRLGCKSGKLAKSHLKCFWISLHLPRRKPRCQVLIKWFMIQLLHNWFAYSWLRIVGRSSHLQRVYCCSCLTNLYFSF